MPRLVNKRWRGSAEIVVNQNREEKPADPNTPTVAFGADFDLSNPISRVSKLE
ncbi:hypothetical protein IE4872_CH00606 [Rhizobium gallicum]|uniref:Uncharacterized protein n=1 Tax=Rhizobium gallicum TaxID=56730 RepID=A0A1L5NED3_9HYPH|nr:hypothetical protein IE4872_CH00606 [Rhizobium gallicum]